jgi:P27 family predicted phage terminase small subunit
MPGKALPFAVPSRRDGRSTHKPEGWVPIEPDWSVLLKDGEASEDTSYLVSAARKEWRRITPLLLLNPMVSHLDDSAIADYCVVWGRLQWAERTLTRTGPFVKSERGRIQRNPIAPLIGELRRQIRGYQSDLYLTPASRARLLRDQPPGPDDLSEFLNAF